jgi:sulfur carrier protein ThiS
MVYFNDKPLPCPDGATLLEILKLAGREPALTVVTVDGKFVPRPDYASLVPGAGARLTVRDLPGGG